MPEISSDTAEPSEPSASKSSPTSRKNTGDQREAVIERWRLPLLGDFSKCSLPGSLLMSMLSRSPIHSKEDKKSHSACWFQRHCLRLFKPRHDGQATSIFRRRDEEWECASLLLGLLTRSLEMGISLGSVSHLDSGERAAPRAPSFGAALSLAASGLY